MPWNPRNLERSKGFGTVVVFFRILFNLKNSIKKTQSVTKGVFI